MQTVMQTLSSAPGSTRAVRRRGGRYVSSGDDGRLLRTITGQIPGETLGFDTTGMGDVNSDGNPDFLLTSAYSAKNGFRSGRVYTVAGR